MWFIFITARLFISLSFQPRLAATLLRSCSVVNSPTRRAGLSPAFQPAWLAQRLIWVGLKLGSFGNFYFFQEGCLGWKFIKNPSKYAKRAAGAMRDEGLKLGSFGETRRLEASAPGQNGLPNFYTLISFD